MFVGLLLQKTPPCVPFHLVLYYNQHFVLSFMMCVYYLPNKSVALKMKFPTFIVNSHIHLHASDPSVDIFFFFRFSSS